jgi:hypothetical protein
VSSCQVFVVDALQTGEERFRASGRPGLVHGSVTLRAARADVCSIARLAEVIGPARVPTRADLPRVILRAPQGVAGGQVRYRTESLRFGD